MRINTVKKGGTCHCQWAPVNVHASWLRNFQIKLIFFPGHKDGFWENVVVNLAMAKKKFERLLIHKLI